VAELRQDPGGEALPQTFWPDLMGRKGGIGRERVKWAEQYHEGSGRDGGGKGKDRYPPHPRPPPCSGVARHGARAPPGV